MQRKQYFATGHSVRWLAVEIAMFSLAGKVIM